MSISAADVKKLRDITSAGMMECKKALEESNGDFDKAVELLRISGAAKLQSAVPSVKLLLASLPKMQAFLLNYFARLTS